MSVADVERYANNVSNSYLSREVITFDGKSRINNEEARQRKYRKEMDSEVAADASSSSRS